MRMIPKTGRCSRFDGEDLCFYENGKLIASFGVTPESNQSYGGLKWAWKSQRKTHEWLRDKIRQICEG